MSAIVIFRGHRSPSLADTVTVDGAAFDLTGSTVKLQMRAAGSSTLKVDTAATIVSAAAGTVRYDWASTDVDTAGFYLSWWHVTLASGKTQPTDDFIVEVRELAGYGARLCEVEDVRASLKKKGDERAEDPIISRYIAWASELISDHCRREFAPATADATRRIPLLTQRRIRRGNARPYLVDLAPYDLRTLTSVSLNPETTAPSSLVVSGSDPDVLAWPHGTAHGTYTGLLIRDSVLVTSDVADSFGHAYIDVRGAWGFSPIPETVRAACETQVMLWLRRNVQHFTTTFSLDEGRVERPRALDSAIVDMLARYQRGPFA